MINNNINNNAAPTPWSDEALKNLDNISFVGEILTGKSLLNTKNLTLFYRAQRVDSNGH